MATYSVHATHPASADAAITRLARLVAGESRPVRKAVHLRLRRHDVELRPVGEMCRILIDGRAGPIYLNTERARSAAIEEVTRLDRHASAASPARRARESWAKRGRSHV